MFDRPRSKTPRMCLDISLSIGECVREKDGGIGKSCAGGCNWLIFDDTCEATVRDLSWSRSKRRQTRGTCGGAWGELQEADRVYARKPDEAWLSELLTLTQRVKPFQRVQRFKPSLRLLRCFETKFPRTNRVELRCARDVHSLVKFVNTLIAASLKTTVTLSRVGVILFSEISKQEKESFLIVKYL